MAASAAHMQSAAQLITELGGGIGLQGVRFLYPDTTNDQLFIAGQFTYANSAQVSPGVLSWNNNQLHSVGCGIEWDCIAFINQAGLGNPALALARWDGDIFLGGFIMFTLSGVDYNWLMRWDGADWHPVEGLDGPVQSLKVIDGDLVVAGWFEHAGSLVVNGLARWDGSAWQEVVPVPPLYAGAPPNRVYDVEKYQGDWYLGGNLGLVNDLARWTGTEWETVGGGFTSAYSRVSRLRVFNDRLIVAGTFARCPPLGTGSDPGSGVVAWDGAQWDDLGGGTCGSSSDGVNDIAMWNDTLYAVGNFDRMGGQAGGGFAKWDGTEWCMMVPADHWGTGTPGALAVFHDSLYVAGSFQLAGIDSVGAFGKWTGGGHVESCGVLTGVDDAAGPEIGWTLYPNPANDQLTLACDTPTDVMVIDALGRTVWSGRINGRETIDVTGWEPGSYVVRSAGGADKLVIMR